jgi:TolA-binding protein
MNKRRWICQLAGFGFATGAYLSVLSPEAAAQTTYVYTADDVLYRTGLELLDKEKYVAAQKAFQDYIALNRNDLKTIDAQYYVAYSALNLSNTDAEPLFERFIAEHPDHPRAQLAYYELGNFYFAKKEYNKAIEFYKKANTDRLSDEQRVEAQFRTGYAYFSQQKFKEAGEVFTKLKRTEHKYTGAANYYSGYIAFRDGKYDEALVDLRKAANSPEYRPLVPYMISSVYYKQQRYDELIAYSEEIKNDKSVRNAEEIALLAGEAYYRKGNYPQAAQSLTSYTKASRTKPATDVQFRLAYAQYQTGDYPNAITNFKPVASSRDTLSQYAAYYLGLSYLKTENKPFALNAFNDAKNGKFNEQIREEAAFNHAKVNYELGNTTESIIALKDFLKAYPGSKHETEANELLSEAYLNSNNYTEALAHLETIKKRSPRINAAYQRVTYNRGVEQFNAAKFKEAVPFFQKALQTSADVNLEVAAHFWMGEAYSAERQYPEAITEYTAVLRLPKTTDGINYQLKSRYGIGYAYYNTQQFDKAQQHFREYIAQVSQSENKRNYDDALLRLADTYYVSKIYNEAVRLYDQAISQNNPEKDYAYFQKGLIHSINGRNEEARTNFNTVVTQYPNSRYVDNALFQKAELDLDNGTYDVAVSGFSKLIEQKPNSSLVPYALLKRAVAYNNQQNHPKAIADYQRIIDQYPTHKTATSAIVGLQETLASAGRGEEFNVYLTKYKKANPENTAVESVEFEAAKTLYFNEKYDKAIQSFTDYARQYPNNALTADAKYYIAESYFRLNDLSNAKRFHQMVIDEGKSQFTSRAIGRMADLELAAKNYPAAARYYNHVLARNSSRKEQFNAWVGLLESYYHTNKYDSAVYFADQIINTGNATLGAQNKALLYRGKIAFAQGNYEKAVDEFLKTLNSARDENGAEAQYLIGESFYKQQKYNQSLDALFELNKNFAAYEKWRSKAFLLISDNYVALNEAHQAKATLNSIIEYSPDKETVEKAKEKLKTLETQQKKAEAEAAKEEVEDDGDEEEVEEEGNDQQ